MSYFVSFLVTIVLSFNSILFIPFSEVEEAFQSGDAAKIMELSKSKVIITMDGKEAVYSQSQGAQILKTFFKSYPPKAFQFTFKGTEKNKDSFALGKYTSVTDSFKISLKFIKEKDLYKIESISFQKERL
jgi:hypothetical protein